MSSPHASPSAEPATRRSRRPWLVGLVVLAVLLLGGGAAVLALTGDERGGDGGDEAGEGSAVVVRTRVVRVAGTLAPATERRLVRDVRSVVEEYVDDAYVEGRTRFPGFTDEARALAHEDADVTTGRRLGDEVVLRSARVQVSVVSPRARIPAGATATLRLVLDQGGGTGTATVTGRLLLTPAAGGWRVFGYDLATSADGERLDASSGEEGER